MTNTTPAMDDSSVVDGATFKPPRIELCQLDPFERTESLVDCWHALQRSSVDAALMPPSDRNMFAFADACIYVATVYDLDYVEPKLSDLEREEKEKKIAEARRYVDELVWKRRLKKRLACFNTLDTAMNGTPSVVSGSGSPGVDGDHDMDDALEDAYQQVQAANSSPIGTSQAIAALSSDAAKPGPQEPTGKWDGDDDELLKVDCVDDGPWTIECGPSRSKSDFVGIAYLAPGTGAASASCEVSLGLALLPHARGKGFGTEITRRLLALAFNEYQIHRVSAGVLGPSSNPGPRHNESKAPSPHGSIGKKSVKGETTTTQVESPTMPGTLSETEAALRLFVALGFTLEGTRRRAVPDLDDNGAWRDAHYLAMLDTDWLALQHRQSKSSFVVRHTRWDEILARHHRETEEFARTESRLKRSASTETLRPSNGAVLDIGGETNTSASSAASEYESSGEQPVPGSDSVRSSPVTSMSNPFRDPVNVSHSRTSTSRLLPATSDNQSQSEGSELDYGEELYVHNGGDGATYSTSLNKVKRFLAAHPAPGPPPSEIGSNLDSESDFESCADPDELALLGSGKGKGKEIDNGKMLLPASFTNILSTGPSTSTSGVHFNPGSHARKKRRLMNEFEGRNSIIANCLPVASQTIKTSPLPCSPNTSNPPSCIPTPLTVLSRETKDFAARSVNAVANTDADSEMDDAGEITDAETVSTATTSAWDVLSGGARSPSPSPSVSSGTGSLSLQSVSEHESQNE